MLRRLFVRPTAKSVRKPSRLKIESLETREVPAAFTPGDVVVLRMGDGSAALSSAATAQFLDEYSPAGNLVQSVALPTAASGSNLPITASGTATSEGALSRSADGKYLVAVGYNATTGTASVASSTVARVIGRIGTDGSIDTSTSTTSFSGNNIRSAATADGSAFWAAGATAGIVYTPLGGSGAGTIVANNSLNNRIVNDFDGQLYVSSGSGTNTFKGVNTVGSGTPNSTGNSVTRLPGLTDTTNPSDYAFFLADLDPGVAGNDTLYVADDSAGIVKFSLVNGNWVKNNVVGAAADSYRGLTGAVVGNTVTLYATRQGTTSPGLYSLVDTTGYNQNMSATPTQLVSLPTNTAFRGVAFAPGNAAPVNTLPANFAGTEDTTTALAGISTGDPDARSANIQVTFSVPSGTLNMNTSVSNGVTSSQVSGNGTGTVVITAPVLTINTTLANSTGLTYTPVANANGNITLQMVTDDLGNTGGSNKTDTDTATIAVAAVNDAPVNSVPGTQSGTEDTALTFSAGNGNAVTTSDVDDNGGDEKVTLTVSHGVLNLGTTSNLSVSGNGTASVTLTGTITHLNTGMDGLTYTPAQDYNGSDTLTIKTDDQANTGSGGAQTDTDTVTINLSAVNDAPVNTLPSSFSASEDVSAALAGISVSDVDAGSADVKVTLSVNNGTLTVATGVSGGVTSGQVSNNGTGSVVITAPMSAINATLASSTGLQYLGSANYFGNDTLTLKTDDQGNTGSGGAQADTDTATITVAPVADTPSVTNTTTNEDTQSTTGLVITRNAADGSEVGYFQITGITNGKLYQHDGTTQISNGDFITFAVANAGLKFTPAQDFNGTASFGVQASLDGTAGTLGGSVVTAQITVDAVNDAPVNNLPGSFTTDEDTSVVLSGISAADVDAGSADVQVTFSVPAGTGTLTLNTGVSGGVTGSQVTGNGTSAVTITAPLAAINATLADANGLSFLGAQDLNGDVTLTMATDDLGNTGSGGNQTDSDTATITINAVNDAPIVSVPGDQTVAEDTALPFGLGTGNVITVADVDAGTGLQLTLTAQHGTLTLATEAGLIVTGDGTNTVVAVGSPADLNVALSGLTYTGDQDYNGPDLIKAAVDDQGNTGTGGPLSTFMNISVDVTAVNDAPVNTAPSSVVTDEDVPFAFTGGNAVSVSDVDDLGADEQVTLMAGHGTLDVGTDPMVTVTGGGTATVTLTGPIAGLNAVLTGLTYTPDSLYRGLDLVHVSTDDLGNTGSGGDQVTDTSVGVTVNPVNHAPVLGDYTFYLNGTVNVGDTVGTVTASDIDGDSIGYAITAGDPGHNFDIDSTGKITIASTAGLPESASLTITATDNGIPSPLSDTGTVSVVRNTAPTTGGIPNQTVNEDAAPNVLDLSTYFSDSEQASNTLSFSITGNTNAGLFQTASISGSALTLTPAADANGSASVTVTATDVGGLSTPATFAFTVNAINDAPSFTAGGNQTANEDDVPPPVTGWATGISAGPSDEAGQTLTFQVSTDNDALFSVLPAIDPTTGTLTYTPAPNANGMANVTVRLHDNGGTGNNGVDTSAPQQFTITVVAVNDAPAIDTSFTPLLPPIKLPIKKGTAPTGGLVSDLVAHVSDVDAGALKGIAITGVQTAAGTWQYTLDGTLWQAMPPVSPTSALLLPADGTAQVRLLPGAKFKNQYADLTFKAWDQSAGTAGGLGDTTNAADTSFSAQTEFAWVAVGKASPVVDAAGHPNLTPKTPLKTGKTSATFTVGKFLGLIAKETDPARTFGIAVSGEVGGDWQFFNTGTHKWQSIGTVSDGSALLLGPKDKVKLVPTANFAGLATLTYHTWDLASGTAGSKVDTAGAGFSAATETAVLAVDDAPKTNPKVHPSLGSAAAGGTTAATTVSAFLNGAASDVNGQVLGIQLTPASAKVGAWQYSTDGGTTWVNVTQTTLLNATAQIRFQVAAGAKAGKYSLTFKAWDGFTVSGNGTATLTVA